MTDWGNLDLSDSSSGGDGDENNNIGWDDDDDQVVDDWEAAPDPDEIARKKKEEEERIQREKQAEIDAEKRRKQELKEERQRRKEAAKRILENYDDDDDFFDVEVIQEKKEQNDFENAKDALGLGENGFSPENYGEIDIGLFVPSTVEMFNEYKLAILKKVKEIFPEVVDPKLHRKEQEKRNNDLASFTQFLITALIDSYKSPFMDELSRKINDLYNTKLSKGKTHPKKSKPNKKFMATKDDGQDLDEDDFDE